MANTFLQDLSAGLVIAEEVGSVLASDAANFEAGQPITPPQPIKLYIGKAHVQVDVTVTKLPN